MSKENLGKFLQDARIKVKLSQKEVADRLGYQTAQYVSNWERGVATPPGRTLRKLADLYRIPAEELYEVILDYVLAQTRQDLQKEFFGSRKGQR